MSEYECVDSVETLTKTLERVKNAQKEFSKYSQEQVDKIFQAAAIAANEARIPLAKMAVEETGMGIVEDKVIKNHYAAEYIYNKYKNEKTCGVIYQDDSYGIKKIAEPVGIVAAVIPTTNPTSTAIFKTLIALKTRNGIIISPHPRAKKSTIEAAKTVLEAAVNAGAPEDIIAWIDVPSLELTNMLMQSADIILATGGPGMVKSAYSSGKPALGVGAGNTPAVIDESANVILAVNSIIHSKTFDNGMICASEQSVIVSDKIYDKVKDEFVKRGCYILNPEETEKVRKTIIINGALNAKIVGQKAHTIAELAGVSVPENTKILIGEVESVDLSEEFAHEKLSPVLAMYKSSSFDDALEKAYRLIEDGGLGHTSSLYVNTVKKNLKNFNVDKEKYNEVYIAIEELENSLINTDIKIITEKYDNLREKTLSLDSELYTLITDQVDVLTTSNTRSRPSKDGEVHIFSRKVYCAVCGKVFQKNNCKSGPRKNPFMKPYLHCRNHKKTGGIQCDNTSYIRYEVLEELVLNEINKIIEKYYNLEKLETNYSSKKSVIDYEKDRKILEKEKNDIEKKLNKTSDRFTMLYDDKADGIITTMEFVMLKNKYQKDIDNFNLRIEEIKKEICELNEKKNDEINEKSILGKYTHIDKLNRLIIDEFISKILIGKKDENNNPLFILDSDDTEYLLTGKYYITFKLKHNDEITTILPMKEFWITGTNKAICRCCC